MACTVLSKAPSLRLVMQLNLVSLCGCVSNDMYATSQAISVSPICGSAPFLSDDLLLPFL